MAEEAEPEGDTGADEVREWTVVVLDASIKEADGMSFQVFLEVTATHEEFQTAQRNKPVWNQSFQFKAPWDGTSLRVCVKQQYGMLLGTVDLAVVATGSAVRYKLSDEDGDDDSVGSIRINIIEGAAPPSPIIASQDDLGPGAWEGEGVEGGAAEGGGAAAEDGLAQVLNEMDADLNVGSLGPLEHGRSFTPGAEEEEAVPGVANEEQAADRSGDRAADRAAAADASLRYSCWLETLPCAQLLRKNSEIVRAGPKRNVTGAGLTLGDLNRNIERLRSQSSELDREIARLEGEVARLRDAEETRQRQRRW